MARPPVSLAQKALLPIAILQFAVPALPSLGIGFRIGDGPGEVMMRAPETPPGAFFAIWGLIFTAYLGVALWAQTSRDYVLRSVTPPLAMAGLASITWMMMRQARLNDVLVYVVLVALFGFAYQAARRFDATRGTGGSPGRWLLDVTTGLLAGWMTLALALSSTELVRSALGFANTDAEWWMLAFALLVASTAALFAFRHITASPYFLAALAWGLLGVVINLWSNVQLHVPAFLTALFSLWLIAYRVRTGARGARATALT
ncbi:MAG: hypothetical protein AAGI03_03715 [Pseudomonadota bacterium]